jgi:hypothetical protein
MSNKTPVVDNKDNNTAVEVKEEKIPLKADKIKELLSAKEVALKEGKKVEAKKIRRALRKLGFYSSKHILLGGKITEKPEEGEEAVEVEAEDTEA